MKFLKRLFKKKTCSSKDGEQLTVYEILLIKKNWKCPDCRVGLIMSGPRGPGAQNVQCNNMTVCGSKFNFYEPSLGFPFEATRISDKKFNKG